jgi:GDPmannose 4,6-dehydratase
MEASFKHANPDWHDHVIIDPLYYRPTEVDFLLADAGKAREKVGMAAYCWFRRTRADHG